MICPNCKNKINYGLTECPYCHHNLSFSTKESNYEVTEKVYHSIKFSKIGIIIGVIIAALIILLIVNSFSMFGIFHVNGALRIFDIILKSLLGLGILGLIISIILLFKSKNVKDMKILLIVSLCFIIIPYTLKSVVHIESNISLNDYSKVKYIEIGNERIPSIYFVVGKRKIFLSNKEDNYYDEDFKRYVDTVSIIYYDLSDDDIEIYINYLVNEGYSYKKIYNENSDDYSIYLLKNNDGDNCFYMICIDGMSVVYLKSTGMYESVFSEY